MIIPASPKTAGKTGSMRSTRLAIFSNTLIKIHKARWSSMSLTTSTPCLMPFFSIGLYVASIYLQPTCIWAGSLLNIRKCAMQSLATKLVSTRSGTTSPQMTKLHSWSSLVPSYLLSRPGSNNSFKPTPLRGAA